MNHLCLIVLFACIFYSTIQGITAEETPEEIKEEKEELKSCNGKYKMMSFNSISIHLIQ
jgi:hypothetical protein